MLRRCITDDGKLNPLLVQLFRKVGEPSLKRVHSHTSPEDFCDLFATLIASLIRVQKYERRATEEEIALLKRTRLFDETKIGDHVPVSALALFAMKPSEFLRALDFCGQRMDKLRFREIFLFTRNAVTTGVEETMSLMVEHEPFERTALKYPWIARQLEKKTRFVHMKSRTTDVWGNEERIKPMDLLQTFEAEVSKVMDPAPQQTVFLFPQPALEIVRVYAEENYPDRGYLFAGPAPVPECPIGAYLTAVQRILQYEVESSAVTA